MKRLFFLPILAMFIGLSSCEVVNQLIPDVDEVFTQTYNVTINEDVPTGISDTTLIDVTSSEDFDDYSQYLSGYEITKVTYEIVDYDAPEDLYFSGSINAFDIDETTNVVLGSFASFNLADAASLGEESEVEQDADAVEQVISWLDNPGSFNLNFSYGFEDAQANTYVFAEEDFGSTFKVKVNFHVTILTGL